MKDIKIEKTKITDSDLKMGRGDTEKELDYKNLIETALDVVPQGGFTPKDIRDRNRIQEALDKATTVIKLEDSDYEALEKIIKDSRWLFRHPDLNVFLQKFEDGIYKKTEEDTKKK